MNYLLIYMIGASLSVVSFMSPDIPACRHPASILRLSRNFVAFLDVTVPQNICRIHLHFLKAFYILDLKKTMATQLNNVIMQGVRGAIGKQVVFRDYSGKRVVSVYPDMSERVLSPKQIRRNEIMKEANVKVSEIKADEQLRNAAQLRLNVTSNKLHHALLKEVLLILGKEEKATTAG